MTEDFHLSLMQERHDEGWDFTGPEADVDYLAAVLRKTETACEQRSEA